MDALANWMDHNPRLLVGMGLPILFILGHCFLQNLIARSVCAVLAASGMITLAVMATLTGRWQEIGWSLMGFIAWVALHATSKAGN